MKMKEIGPRRGGGGRVPGASLGFANEDTSSAGGNGQFLLFMGWNEETYLTLYFS